MFKNKEDLVKTLVEPEVHRLIDSLLEGFQPQIGSPGSLQSMPSEEEQKAAAQEVLWKHLSMEVERKRVAEGMTILIKHLDSVSSGAVCKEELRTAGQKLSEQAKEMLPQIEEQLTAGHENPQEKASSDKGDQVYSASTLGPFYVQLGISNETFETLYQITRQLYEEGIINDALPCFQALTVLNAFCPEAWQGLGLCLQNKKEFFNALHAYASAAALRPADPLPHIQSTRCYLAAGDRESARASLDLAEYLLDEASRKTYEEELNSLREQVA